MVQKDVLCMAARPAAHDYYWEKITVLFEKWSKRKESTDHFSNTLTKLTGCVSHDEIFTVSDFAMFSITPFRQLLSEWTHLKAIGQRSQLSKELYVCLYEKTVYTKTVYMKYITSGNIVKLVL